MSPMLIERPTAGEAMIAMPKPLNLDSTVAEALKRMRVEEAAFLTVVSPATQKLLGFLTRDSLTRYCASEGHEPGSCPVVRHLDANPDFCFEEENAEEVLLSDGGWRPASSDAGGVLPVVVVNAEKVPVGFLER